MPSLVFEIWEDADHQFEMAMVSERGDRLRVQISPYAVLRHTFTAQSDFEAFQTNSDWHAFGRWKPEPDWEEHFFTEEEAAEQQRYLKARLQSS